MPPSIEAFLITYGYLSIFILIFTQELGVPSFPNELLLLFLGYLCSKSIFSLWGVLFLSIFADVSGSTLVYFLLFYCSNFLRKITTYFIKSPRLKHQKLRQKFSENSGKAIALGRLTPFMRGYVCAIAGSMRVPYKQFCIIVCSTSILWNGGFILTGWFLGAKFHEIAKYFN